MRVCMDGIYVQDGGKDKHSMLKAKISLRYRRQRQVGWRLKLQLGRQ